MRSGGALAGGSGRGPGRDLGRISRRSFGGVFFAATLAEVLAGRADSDCFERGGTGREALRFNEPLRGDDWVTGSPSVAAAGAPHHRTPASANRPAGQDPGLLSRAPNVTAHNVQLKLNGSASGLADPVDHAGGVEEGVDLVD
jgi:hypothetical protein